MKATGTELANQTEEGMVMVPVPLGIALISPAQLNRNVIVDKLRNARQQGGMLAAIDPNILDLVVNLLEGLLEDTAVLPEQNPGSAAAASSSAMDTTAGLEQAAVRTAGKRPADISPNEIGTGEALAKQQRDVVLLETAPTPEQLQQLENQRISHTMGQQSATANLH